MVMMEGMVLFGASAVAFQPTPHDGRWVRSLWCPRFWRPAIAVTLMPRAIATSMGRFSKLPWSLLSR